MRTVNRIASALLALVLIAGGLLVVVQTVSALVDRPWPIPTDWRRELGDVALSERRVLAICIAIGVVGLIVLIAELMPRRQARLPATMNGTTWWVSRRSAERRSANAAAVGGSVAHPRADVSGNAQRWRVRVRAEAPPHRYEAVERSVREELRALGAPDEITVATSLKQKGRVA